MNQRDSWLSNDTVTRAAAIRNEAMVCSACCSVMSVTYVPSLMRVDIERMSDTLEIMVAAKDPLLYLSYRAAGGQGSSSREATVTNEAQRSERVLISMDREFLRRQSGIEVASRAFGLGTRCCVANSVLKALGDALLEDFRIQRIPAPTYLQSVAGVIAEALAAHHHIDAKHATSQGLQQRKLVAVLRYIEEHIARYMVVAELAATAHMSPYHFTRSFKMSVGLPPHVYITMRRVEHAKRWLGETDVPLVDVAAAVGFQTQGHFTTVFRRHAGITPRTFRLVHGAGERFALESRPSQSA